MATHSKIVRLEQRIEALAASRSTKRIIVVDPSETHEQALQRAGLPLGAASRTIFIHTGVPRWSPDRK